MICLELHAGASAYNPASFARLARGDRPERGREPRPEPLLVAGDGPAVAVIEQVGARDRLRPRQGHARPPRSRAPERPPRPGLPGRRRHGLVALRRRRHGPRRRHVDGARPGAPRSGVRRRHLDRARGSAHDARGGRRDVARDAAASLRSASRPPHERHDARRRPPLRRVGGDGVERRHRHRPGRRRHPGARARRHRRARLQDERGRAIAQAPRDPDARRRHARRAEPLPRGDRAPDRAARTP